MFRQKPNNSFWKPYAHTQFLLTIHVRELYSVRPCSQRTNTKKTLTYARTLVWRARARSHVRTCVHISSFHACGVSPEMGARTGWLAGVAWRGVHQEQPDRPTTSSHRQSDIITISQRVHAILVFGSIFGGDGGHHVLARTCALLRRVLTPRTQFLALSLAHVRLGRKLENYRV